MDFSGWELPVQYVGVLAEHQWCRSQAALFDTGHMGQFVFRGPSAVEALGAVCTQDAAALAVGRCRYGFLLNEAGGVLDDTILMRLGPEEFLLVVNAGTQADDWQWMAGRLPAGVERTNLSAAGWGKMDLQGPRALEAMGVFGAEAHATAAALPYFGVARMRCAGAECTVSRTGYTGELGYEIMAPGGGLPTLAEALLGHEAVRPAGLGARDSLRLEMGYPLYGHELSVARNPLEAGLDMFLPLGPERAFVGAAAMRAVRDAGGPAERLVAFRAETRRRMNPGDGILSAGERVGVVTSGAFSPSLEVSIGMGYVRADLAKLGTELTVATGRAEVAATVCDKPMYPKGTCRVKTTGS